MHDDVPPFSVQLVPPLVILLGPIISLVWLFPLDFGIVGEVVVHERVGHRVDLDQEFRRRGGGHQEGEIGKRLVYGQTASVRSKGVR